MGMPTQHLLVISLTVLFNITAAQSLTQCTQPPISGGHLTRSLTDNLEAKRFPVDKYESVPYYMYCYQYKREVRDLDVISQNPWYCTPSGWARGIEDVCLDVNKAASDYDGGSFYRRQFTYIIFFSVTVFVSFAIAAIACCVKKKPVVTVVDVDDSEEKGGSDDGDYGSDKKKKRHRKHKHSKHGKHKRHRRQHGSRHGSVADE